MSRLTALAALLLAASLSAQTPPARPAPSADSAAVDSTAPSAPASASPRARLDSAALAPRGPFPPLDPSLAGVVWNAPADAEAAVADLVAMRRAGVRAVRTELIEETAVLDAASRLGIALWQDLPIEGLPALFLRARTDEAAQLLAEALDRSRPYSAARHFGLAQSSDTSDPRARPYFEALTELAHDRGAEGTQTYYVSRFPVDDRSARTVDLVLLDARDGDPVALLRRWRTEHDTPVGLASMGTGVRPGQPGGWRTLGTEAAQARTLENAFTDLLGLSEPPAAAFVYRWRDTDADRVERDQRAEVTGTRFGLLGPGDEPRPALDVASGFWTGRQRVFAFDAGSEARQERRASPLLLIGWGLVLGLGVFYAGAPRLGSLAPRYFGRRDLYREAVQRGFDLSAFETSGLALALTLAAGVVGTSVLRALARTDALVAATSSWTLDGQARLTSLLGQPLLLVGVLALAYAAWLLLNLIWLNVITGRRRLRPAQALSLAVWCRWGWFPLMILSLLLGSIDPQLATVLAPTVLGVGLLIEVVAGYKMMWDLQAVTHAPPARAILLGFGLPFLLAVAGLVALGITSRDEIGFLWHLATRA
ncbi:hypothetical protein [Rubrivirga marina]|uniref:Uncharacterized protein n=1 Tax=Rubrivirga marina TaxID=1196024 RepID=A0A271IWL3_9BACT|nr:hypothetical protein [Rubrivirga marina]PAP75497.1 hypothetical protein BSZ37_03070 [Rubrivirga marina]